MEPEGWRSSDGYRFDYKLYKINDADNIIKEELNSNSQEFKILESEELLEYEGKYTIEIKVSNPNLDGI